MNHYPKRLIEVDLPIKRISAHARREKSIRHGHISTLHIWWARRPLAACRAVLCASLWPDPADELCPEVFRAKAKELMQKWANEYLQFLGEESVKRFTKVRNNAGVLDDNEELRNALLDFIADFANWDNSTKKEYLETSRELTQVAHEALGGVPGTKPLVVDPFAGGGSIPLEALRVGADAFASDLNPVAVLLNKVVLEYIPKYGKRLADEVRKWGKWIKEEAEKELAEFYPKDPDGATPIAYLWARTIQCEGPGCGAEVPLMRSFWLAKRNKNSVALKLVPNPKKKRVDFEIIHDAKIKDIDEGTVKRGSATCPCCGYTTPVQSVRRQLRSRKGGASDARLFCVVVTRTGEQGRFYRLSNNIDYIAITATTKELEKKIKDHKGHLSLVPDEMVNPLPHSINRLPMYGMDTWGDAFSERQLLSLSLLARLVRELDIDKFSKDNISDAVKTCLALSVDSCTDHNASLCTWRPNTLDVSHVFGRQALSMTWDFAEVVPTFNSTGSFEGSIDRICRFIDREKIINSEGHTEISSATNNPLPDDSVSCLFTDPPYYDMIDYSNLSDFFYVWLKRILPENISKYWNNYLIPKAQEIIVEPTLVDNKILKNEKFYLDNMTKSFREVRRILSTNGIGVVVFAHKSTKGWESLLQSMIDAGLTITGAWPIDTEMAGKVAGLGQARLVSSIHLVCRPRKNIDGTKHYNTGDWRDVLQELPGRIREWMKRLAKENVVGADAIFACLGPALEIFSRYSRVEKASGEEVTLKEYLEHVWAVIAREALGMIFEGADATGFEEDARLTAMWLWTLSEGKAENGKNGGTSKANGYGDGSGSGFTDGTGFGGGTGPGAGFADGTGYGRGTGSGSGFADGTGYGGGTGSGTGFADGTGYGGGTGSGTGFADGTGYGGGTGSGTGFADGTGYGGGTGSGTGFADGTGYGGGTGSGAGFADGTGSGRGNDDEDDEDSGKTKKQSGGYFLEYDAARKIAQGLGAHLEKLDNLVEVKGSKARLLPVSERIRTLFGKQPDENAFKTVSAQSRQIKHRGRQTVAPISIDEIIDGFFAEDEREEAPAQLPEKVKSKADLLTGRTTLDKVHQSMILFGLNRSEALRRFIVDDGTGKDARFWKLAQALSALYPSHTEEKRWVDGVLARKKGFGF